MDIRDEIVIMIFKDALTLSGLTESAVKNMGDALEVSIVCADKILENYKDLTPDQVREALANEPR